MAPNRWLKPAQVGIPASAEREVLGGEEEEGRLTTTLVNNLRPIPSLTGPCLAKAKQLNLRNLRGNPKVEVEALAVSKPLSVDKSSSPLCINSHLPVGGRLSHFAHFWEQNVQDTWALEVVRQGYALEFEGPPPTFQGVRVTRANGDRARFLREEIQSLLLKNAIERVPPGEVEEGFYSTFFLTPKKEGTWRPILNLKPLNAHLRSPTFKMETLRSVVRAVDPGDWMASIDLKDAYLHVPVRKSHHKYLRFAFEGVSYQCKVLMFGLKTGPFVWTKILAPILAMIHGWGIYISPYLDDLILKNSDKSALVEQLPVSLQTLINAGFIINLQKSELLPCQDLVYIGGRLRTDLGLVTLPQDRMEAFLRSLSKLKVGSTQTAGFFQHILGMIAAMLDVVPYARLRMRPLQVHLKRHWNQAAQPQSTRIPVTERLTPCLQWWSSKDNLLAGLPLCPPKPTVTITSDASKKGWGAFLLEHAVQGLWGPWEKAFHINFLELKAIWLGLKAFQDNVRGKVVLCRCDNTTACAYINKMGGTKSQVLTSLLTQFMEWCIERNIQLQAVHLPGVKNVLADMLSRTETDHKEWSLNTRVTDRLFLAWGKPQVDLFASRQNAKLPTFCSLHREEELALSWDALSMTWSRGELYAFPPLGMIPIVLDKIKRDQAPRVILIAPNWPRRSWYPLLLNLLQEPPIALPTQEEMPGLLTQKVKGKTLRHPNPDPLHLTAWLLSGVASRVGVFQPTWQQHSLPLVDSQHIKNIMNVGKPL